MNQIINLHLSLIGLILLTVLVELTRQGLKSINGDSIITEGLGNLYEILCKLVGYSLTPHYILLWKIPRWVIKKLPIWIEKLNDLMIKCLNKLSNLLVRFIKWFGRKLKWFLNHIVEPILRNIYNFVKYILDNTIFYVLNKIAQFFRWLDRILIEICNFVRKLGELLWNKFMNLLDWLLTNIVITTIKKIWHWTKYGWYLIKYFYFTYIQTVIDYCWSIAKSIINKIYNTITNIIMKTYSAICNIISKSYFTIAKIVSKTYQSISDSIWNIYQNMINMAAKLIGYQREKAKQK